MQIQNSVHTSRTPVSAATALKDITQDLKELALASAMTETRRQTAPWLTALSESARCHLQTAILPTLQRLRGGTPQWTLWGRAVPQMALYLPQELLTSLLVVGAHRLERYPTPLFETRQAVFRYVPGMTVTHFDYEAFIVGLMTADETRPAQFDALPILEAYDQILKTRKLTSVINADQVATINRIYPPASLS